MADQTDKSWKVEYLSDPGIVELTYTGALNGEVMREALAARIEVGERHDCSRFLVDMLQARTDESFIKMLFERLSFFIDLKNMPPGHRIAILKSDSERFRWLVSFYERLTADRGWRVKRFCDREAALRWLFETS